MASGDVSSMITIVVEAAKTGLSLFTEWPLNIVVAAGVLGIGIKTVARFIPRKTK